jgi:hypothetical protein
LDSVDGVDVVPGNRRPAAARTEMLAARHSLKHLSYQSEQPLYMTMEGSKTIQEGLAERPF